MPRTVWELLYLCGKISWDFGEEGWMFCFLSTQRNLFEIILLSIKMRLKDEIEWS
jgi:hypothetical protein